MAINSEDGAFSISYSIDEDEEEDEEDIEYGDSDEEVRERALQVIASGRFSFATLSRLEDGEWQDYASLSTDDLEDDE